MTLGHFTFDDGLELLVDRPMVLGRRPAADVLIDDERALPVVLPDPDQVLSRTHLEVRISGWQVQLVDRDSMNGTFVILLDRPPFRLHPGEPYPLPPGSAVSLGDAVAFTYRTETTGAG